MGETQSLTPLLTTNEHSIQHTNNIANTINCNIYGVDKAEDIPNLLTQQIIDLTNHYDTGEVYT